MSRPDLYPHERDAWEASVHAELETRKGWPTTSQMGLLRRQTDTLSQRMADSYAPIPWGTIAFVSIVLVLIVVLAVLAAMGGKP